MAEYKFAMCAPDDPNRCQGVLRTGQCPYVSLEGTKYCPRHGGNASIESKCAKDLKMYRLQLWQERVDEFKDSDERRTLASEIGVLRLLLETVVKRCQSDTDLILQSSKISDLTVKLEKLVSSTARLDHQAHQFLDKSAAINFAGQIVDIVANEITDTLILDKVSSRIIEALASLTGEKPG